MAEDGREVTGRGGDHGGRRKRVGPRGGTALLERSSLVAGMLKGMLVEERMGKGQGEKEEPLGGGKSQAWGQEVPVLMCLRFERGQ